MTNKHPDALDDGTFSKSTIKRFDLCTSGEHVKESAESMQMDALVAKWRADHRDYPEAKQDCADELEANLPKLLADANRYMWLKANVSGGSFGLTDGWLDDNVAEWDGAIDAAMRDTLTDGGRDG